MSRSVRIPDHLAERIEAKARFERRKFSNMVAVLLERALEGRGVDSGVRSPRPSSAQFTDADAQPRDVEARRIR